MRQADKTGLAPPQGRHAGHREDRLKPWVEFQQRVDRVFEVGLTVELEGHAIILHHGRACPGHPRLLILSIKARGSNRISGMAVHTTSVNLDQALVVMLVEPHFCKTWMPGTSPGMTG